MIGAKKRELMQNAFVRKIEKTLNVEKIVIKK
jgi:hypothetical protein